MGSDANWQSLLLEFKGYKKFPAESDNVIALWSYNWFTFGGKASLFAFAEHRLGL
jgi:hypothetical protein